MIRRDFVEFSAVVLAWVYVQNQHRHKKKTENAEGGYHSVKCSMRICDHSRGRLRSLEVVLQLFVLLPSLVLVNPSSICTNRAHSV